MMRLWAGVMNVFSFIDFDDPSSPGASSKGLLALFVVCLLIEDPVLSDVGLVVVIVKPCVNNIVFCIRMRFGWC